MTIDFRTSVKLNLCRKTSRKTIPLFIISGLNNLFVVVWIIKHISCILGNNSLDGYLMSNNLASSNIFIICALILQFLDIFPQMQLFACHFHLKLDFTKACKKDPLKWQKMASIIIPRTTFPILTGNLFANTCRKRSDEGC